LYYLYIDESGHTEDYNPSLINDPLHRYFCLSGIIVEDSEVSIGNAKMREIIQNRFTNKGLTLNKKLSYHDLRQRKKYPYNQLTREECYNVASDVFNTILNLDFTLLSCSIDLFYIYNKYFTTIPQRDLALNFISERFQYFVNWKLSQGQLVHEYVSATRNKELQTNFGRLFSKYHLPRTTDFTLLSNKIKFARSSDEPILQFSDFFAYAILIRVRTQGVKQSRWESISSKYYNLNHASTFLRGNCSI